MRSISGKAPGMIHPSFPSISRTFAAEVSFGLCTLLVDEKRPAPTCIASRLFQHNWTRQHPSAEIELAQLDRLHARQYVGAVGDIDSYFMAFLSVTNPMSWTSLSFSREEAGMMALYGGRLRS